MEQEHIMMQEKQLNLMHLEEQMQEYMPLDKLQISKQKVIFLLIDSLMLLILN